MKKNELSYKIFYVHPSFIIKTPEERLSLLVSNDIAIGLSQIAMDTVRRLQGRNPEFNPGSFERWDAFLSERNQPEGQFTLRRDGVFGESLNFIFYFDIYDRFYLILYDRTIYKELM